MEEKKYGITLAYLCSFAIFCLINYVSSIFLARSIEDPIFGSMILIGFTLLIGILGSVTLNYLFRPLICEKHNLLTCLIFVAHLILIPYGSILLMNNLIW